MAFLINKIATVPLPPLDNNNFLNNAKTRATTTISKSKLNHLCSWNIKIKEKVKNDNQTYAHVPYFFLLLLFN